MHDRRGHGILQMPPPEKATEREYQQARASIQDLLGRDIIAETTLVHKDGELRASLLPTDTRFMLGTNPQTTSSVLSVVGPGISPRTKSLQAKGHVQEESTPVSTGRVGALKLWNSFSQLSKTRPQDETIDLILSEIARQNYKHCAERGLLVEQLRLDISRLLAGMVAKVGQAETSVEIVQAKLRLESQEAAEQRQELNALKSKLMTQTTSEMGSQTPIEWEMKLDPHTQQAVMELKLKEKQQELDGLRKQIQDLDKHLDEVGVQTEQDDTDSAEVLGLKEALFQAESELALQKAETDTSMAQLTKAKAELSAALEMVDTLRRANTKLKAKHINSTGDGERERQYVDSLALIEELESRVEKQEATINHSAVICEQYKNEITKREAVRLRDHQNFEAALQVAHQRSQTCESEKEKLHVQIEELERRLWDQKGQGSLIEHLKDSNTVLARELEEVRLVRDKLLEASEHTDHVDLGEQAMKQTHEQGQAEDFCGPPVGSAVSAVEGDLYPQKVRQELEEKVRELEAQNLGLLQERAALECQRGEFQTQISELQEQHAKDIEEVKGSVLTFEEVPEDMTTPGVADRFLHKFVEEGAVDDATKSRRRLVERMMKSKLRGKRELSGATRTLVQSLLNNEVRTGIGVVDEQHKHSQVEKRMSFTDYVKEKGGLDETI